MPKKIGKILIMRDREVMPSPAYWVPVSYSSSTTRKIYGVNLAGNWLLFSGGMFKSHFLQKKWDKAAKFIGKKLFSDAKYFNAIKKKTDNSFLAFERFYQRVIKDNLKKKSFKQLIARLKESRDTFLRCEDTNTLAWFTGSEFMQGLLRKNLKIKEDDFLFLTTPEQKTQVGQMELDILEAAKLVKTRKKKVSDLASKISYKYGWIPFSYDGPTYWDEKYFISLLNKESKKDLKKIESEIKNIKDGDRDNRRKKREIIERNGFTKKQLDLISKFNQVATWTDERKVYVARSARLFSLVIWELEKRYKVPYKNLKYLFIEEIARLEKEEEKLLKVSKERIEKPFLIKFDEDKFRILPEKERDFFLAEVKKQQKTSELRGMVASRGDKDIYRGKAVVLVSPKECGKVKEGDFLVATMTTPDYVLAMKKAAAFITDEGGVTCHAAIVAREMGKPCIIGTKNATKVLKDGMMVEVDMTKGLIRIENNNINN